MKTHTKLPLCALAIFGLALTNASQAALVGYWDFNEGSGTTAIDSTTNGNNGTLTAFNNDTPNLPEWAPGKYGTGLKFDNHGTEGGNVTIPDAVSLQISNTFTIAAWFNETSNSNYGHLFVTGDGGANGRSWLLQTDNGGDAAYFWSGGGNTEFNHSLGFQLPNGGAAPENWHHIAITYDGSTMKNYLDGTLIGSQFGVSSALDTWGTLRLGGFNVAGSGFGGSLDDMVIFNTDETANIASIMAGTHTEMMIPEPTSLALLVLGGLGLLRRRRA